MSNLAAKHTRLKKLVGGNREVMGYEETFGMPREEAQYVTMPNKWIRRILGQIEFAIRLSGANEGQFDGAIGAALDYLMDCMQEDGVLTKAACLKAEEMLLPLQPAAKEYSLILAAHAHIDMNWMWGWQETVAATLATFRTMLNLMDEYPDFCFSQSQTSVYKIVEDYDPELMERIKQRIQEGRWEVTATAWVETDKNMPNTESLLRHIKYTRDYMQEKWGVDPDSLEVDFSPDTFGHSAFVPEINNYGNVKYYYHCRGLDGDNALYRWRAPSGKEVLVYREQYWYNSGITPKIGAGLIDISRRSGGLKTGLIVYGVGDHGGGPSRRDVERAMEMMQWPVFPALRFGTVREFFHIAESVREKLPVVDHEMNFTFPGCYTTQSRLKLANRRCEAQLVDAENISALANKTTGATFAPRQFESAWQKVLFTHFHDILTGSCVQDSREHAMGLFAEAMAVANTQHANATRRLAEQIDTSFIVTDGIPADSQSEGAGVGYGLSSFTGVPSPERGAGRTRIFHIFNPSAHDRTEPVEITVWDWVGDMRYIRLEDSKGEELSFQLLDSSLQQYWDHKYFRFLVDATVPALGYTTVVLRETDPEEYRIYYQGSERTNKETANFVLENEHLRAEFDYKNGEMISFIDKSSGSELLCKCGAGLRYIETESDSSSAWNIGRYTHIEPMEQMVRIHALPAGDLRQGFEMEQKIKNSTVKATVTLDKHAKAVTYHYEIDWHEVGLRTTPVPVLAYVAPLGYEAEQYLYDVPAGALYRKSQRIDVPALQYASAVKAGGKSLALVTNCKYGYRGADNTLTATLINATHNPDPYPERGIHKITLSVAVEDACPKAMEELATDINHGMSYQPVVAHKGTLPAESALLRFESDTAVLSSVSLAKDGSLLVRAYETCGKPGCAKVTLGFNAKEAQLVDLSERVTGEAKAEGNTVCFELAANSLACVKIS